MMDDLLICVPARYYSSRLEGKPLFKINNLTIINLVYINILKIKNIKKSNIIILTEDKKIYDEVINFGGNCYISKNECNNGTLRIIDYLKENNIKKKYILNIQGDEPYFDIDNLQKLINYFINLHENEIYNNVKCGTLYYKVKDYNYVNSKNRVKLVISKNNYIMYGSRQVIPGSKKGNEEIEYKIHIGIFIFNYDYLINDYNNENYYYEKIEDLEWLKILEQDYKICAFEVDTHEIGVDTLEDYNYLKNKYEKK